MTNHILDRLRNLGKHRPDIRSLKEHIEQSLHEMPFAQDRSKLDQQVGDQQAGDV